ncbi:ABC transporter substrate-binding protein [Nocardioides hwasunensis]|uniref:ABC transporter substrate-binding protein n=1 Tax=Nocardioides hwasunensis TaxID=397258 RepID=A0ABR8MG68_9ACTN|nr:ABC transporter substrate-binding protein [Nocardioides hwasunensis]MBD3915069.1 ABC transporter substrate-binding protein [Nocardioides hwasunensis]
MSKKLVGLTVALTTLSTALAGCGGGGDSASGAGGDEIVIGAFSPLSGPAVSASSGIYATKAALDKVNDAGGIDGHKIKFIIKDDQFDPAKTPGVTRELVETDRVSMLCGPQGSVPFGAVKDYLAARKIPTIVNAGAPTLAGEYSYLVSSPFDGVGAMLAQFAVEDLDIDKVAIAYSDDALGTSARDGAVRILEADGLEPLGEIKYDITATDFSSQAIQLKATGADFVSIPAAQANVAGLVINAAEKIGYKPIWGLSYAAQNKTLVDVTKGAIDGRAYFATPYITEESETGAEYAATLAEYAPDVEVNSGATIAGYTIGELCVDVLTKAVEAADGEVPTSAQIQETLSSYTADNDYIQGIDWSDEPDGAAAAQILQLKDGKYVESKPFAPLP